MAAATPKHIRVPLGETAWFDSETQRLLVPAVHRGLDDVQAQRQRIRAVPVMSPLKSVTPVVWERCAELQHGVQDR